jgi:FKBP-type peptidyl-prolyl cis-trans isomerase
LLAGPGLAAILALALALACRPASDDASTRPPEPEPPAEAPARADASASAMPLAPPNDATVTLSGTAFVLLEPGDAAAPKAQWADFVELRYRVWDEDGRLVGHSREGRSERLAISWLPPGWAEVVLAIPPGAHARIWVPELQAYASAPGGPRGALRIEMELVGVEHTEVSREDATPLLTPPPTALRTASGIWFVVLRPGTGTRHATPEGRVTVHYEGWTADGNRFDSSYARGDPATFPLAAVIAGWQEAVPLMVEGEKTRFWIPAEMAYGDAPGRPNGMLVFDIELVRIDG